MADCYLCLHNTRCCLSRELVEECGHFLFNGVDRVSEWARVAKLMGYEEV